MNLGSQPALSAIGFISILPCDSLGWVGGLLAVNPRGRPLEFHCTVPVSSNRAQEILYGATFEDYFFGELLAGNLLLRVKSRLDVVLTDHRGVLGAREQWTTCPIVWLMPPQDGDAEDEAAPMLAAHPNHRQDVGIAQALIDQLPGAWPLREPLERIGQAVREAQRAA